MTEKYFGSSDGLTILHNENCASRITSKYSAPNQYGDIKGAFCLNTDTGESISGSELVTNGTFDSDASGWSTTSPMTITHDATNKDLDIARNSGDGVLSCYQSINLVANTEYMVWVNVKAISQGIQVYIGSTLVIDDNTTTAKQYVGYFTATTTEATNIDIRPAYSLGATLTVDDISVIPFVRDRSVNSKSIGVHGTITTSPVATDAELLGMSGFSSSNYLEQPYNADLDFGAGDFSIGYWFKCAATAFHERLFLRGNYDSDWSGAAIQMRVEAYSSYLTAQITADGYSTFDTLSSSRAVDDGVYHHAVLARSGNTAYLYLDGNLVDSVSLNSAAGSLSNSDATLRLGSGQDNSIPLINGTIALPRITATALTAEEIKRIYESEKPLFYPNAACTLNGGSDSVSTISYDEETGLLHTGTSGGRSSFSGLVRVDETDDATTLIASGDGLLFEGI